MLLRRPVKLSRKRTVGRTGFVFATAALLTALASALLAFVPERNGNPFVAAFLAAIAWLSAAGFVVRYVSLERIADLPHLGRSNRFAVCVHLP
jgi:hypothetical protein